MVQTKRYAGLTAANTKKVAMAAPMFSIIIPTLNVAAVLPACLDSIARQTCGDFELVLVDGGSTDETLDIANIFAPNLGERLIIHRDTDQGVYDAMNRGVDLATGTWLLFLGADDSLYEADTLARVAAFIGEHEPSDLVYGDVIMRSTNFRWGGAFDLDRLLFKRNQVFYLRLLHSFGRQLGTDCLAPFVIRVGHVLKEHQAEDHVLVLAGRQRPAQLVGGLPERVFELLHRRRRLRRLLLPGRHSRFLPIDAPRRCRAWWASSSTTRRSHRANHAVPGATTHSTGCRVMAAMRSKSWS